MADTAEQLTAYEQERAAKRRLPIYIGAFDEQTCAEKIIAEAQAIGVKNAMEGRAVCYASMAGVLQAEVAHLCEKLHELQHRPAEVRARATRKRHLRESMMRRAA